MPDNMGKNGEGYPDPTAGSAWRNIRKEENRREMERAAVISNLIPIMKQTAELAGFEEGVIQAIHRQEEEMNHGHKKRS